MRTKPAATMQGDVKRSNLSRRATGGFTLVELLVVVAVIAMLAGILLPALSRAKQASHSAVCKSNLRQWGLALEFYLDEFECFPPDQMPEPDLRQWDQRLNGYAGTKSLKQITDVGVCPGYQRLSLGIFRTFGNQGSYAYNSSGLKGTPDRPGSVQGLGGTWLTAQPSKPTDVQVRKESDVICPSDMIAVGDSLLNSLDAASPASSLLPPGSKLILGSPLYYVAPSTYAPICRELGMASPSGPSFGDPRILQTAIQQRHGGRWNVVFCDGHVESLRTRELFNPKEDRIIKRWNCDNLPHRENLPTWFR